MIHSQECRIALKGAGAQPSKPVPVSTNSLLNWRCHLWWLKISFAWQLCKVAALTCSVLTTNTSFPQCMLSKSWVLQSNIPHFYLEMMLEQLHFGLTENVFSAVYHKTKVMQYLISLRYPVNALPNSDFRYVWKSSYCISWISQN